MNFDLPPNQQPSATVQAIDRRLTAQWSAPALGARAGDHCGSQVLLLTGGLGTAAPWHREEYPLTTEWLPPHAEDTHGAAG
jgi:ketopantoate hydroxymethyltransferase